MRNPPHPHMFPLQKTRENQKILEKCQFYPHFSMKKCKKMGCFYMEKCNSNANMFDSQKLASIHHSPRMRR